MNDGDEERAERFAGQDARLDGFTRGASRGNRLARLPHPIPIIKNL